MKWIAPTILWIVVMSGIVDAQAQRYGLPGEAPYSPNVVEGTADRSPDGRIAVQVTPNLNFTKIQSPAHLAGLNAGGTSNVFTKGLVAFVLRPENVIASPNGHFDFNAANFASDRDASKRPTHVVAILGDPWERTDFPIGWPAWADVQQTSGQPNGLPVTVRLINNPERVGANPYPCDASGTELGIPLSLVDGANSHACYELRLVSHRVAIYDPGRSIGVTGNLPDPIPAPTSYGNAEVIKAYNEWLYSSNAFPPNAHPGWPLKEKREVGYWPLKIVVEAPYTAAARVSWSELGEFVPYRFLDPVNGLTNISGIEASAGSFDPCFIVMNGPLDNEDNAHGHLMVTHRPDTSDPNGWVKPYRVTELHGKRASMLGSRPLEDRIPLASLPIVDPTTGVALSSADTIEGAYPWCADDNDKLTFTTMEGKGWVKGVWKKNDSRRKALALLSPTFTHNAIYHIDGPMNISRWKGGAKDASGNPLEWKHRRLASISWGETGLWRPFPYPDPDPVLLDKNIPPREDQGRFLILTEITGLHTQTVYAPSRDKVLMLSCGEAVSHIPLPVPPPVMETGDGFDYVRDTTPDRSGGYRFGTFQGACGYPEEMGLGDAQEGIIGQGVICDAPQSSIVVASDPALEPPTMSFGMFFKIESFDGDVKFAEQAGRFELATVGGSAVQLTLAGVPPITGGTVLDGIWQHVLFTYHEPTTTARLYVDGVEVASNSSVPPLPVTGSELHVGWLDGTIGRLFVDEIEMDRVALDADEARAEAWVAPIDTTAPDPFFVNNADLLPPGIVYEELQVPASNPTTSDGVRLGKTLFSDPMLGNNRSCQSCHLLATETQDNRALAQHFDPTQPDLKRGTPVSFNRMLEQANFWDGRAATLEEQAVAPLDAFDEMGTTLAAAVQYCRNNYLSEFQAAFPGAINVPNDITDEHLGKVLAQYMRAGQISGGSAADLHKEGVAALTGAAANGWQLFRTTARCSSCHLSNGNFSDARILNTGVALQGAADQGRYDHTLREGERGAFKVPTLREVEFTAPYFHDGSAAALDDVVKFYNRGGSFVSPPAPIDGVRDPDAAWKLGLTQSEIDDVVAYLLTLTGDTLPDAFEPNESISASVALAIGDADTAAIHVVDDDWYQFPNGGTFRIDFTHATGDLDMVAYNSAGLWVGSSTSVSNSEQLVVPAGGYVWVYGYLGARNPYTFLVQ